jgi:hypothetical protein
MVVVVRHGAFVGAQWKGDAAARHGNARLAGLAAANLVFAHDLQSDDGDPKLQGVRWQIIVASGGRLGLTCIVLVAGRGSTSVP